MHPFFHKLSRSSRKALEITLGVVIVIMIVVCFCLWQMSRQPFDLMFAEEYIENALSTDEYHVNFDDVDLKWPQMKGPLRLDIKGMKMLTPDGGTALSIDQVDIGISSRFLIIGLIRPVSLYLDSPVFRIVQDDEGNVTFLFQNTQIEDDEEAKPLGEQIAQALETFANPQEDNFLRRFHFLVIQDARVVLEDAESGEEVTLSEMNARFERNRNEVVADADLIMNDDLIEDLSGFSIHANYDRKSHDTNASVAFRNISPSQFSLFFPDNEIFDKQSGVVNGQVALSLDAQQQVKDFSGSVQVSDGAIYWPQEYDEPVRIDGFNLTLGFDPARKTVESEAFDFKIQDVPVTGAIIMHSGADFHEAVLNLNVPEIKQETLETLFPKSELDGELAEWLVHKMDGGVFRNVKANIPLTLKKQVDEQGAAHWAFIVDDSKINVVFEAEGVNLVYQDTLMPASDIKGSGGYDGSKLVVNGESGKIKDIVAREIKVVVDDVAVKGGGYAHISLKAKGPLPTILRYIADEPIAMAEDVGFKPDEVKGTADVLIEVGLPTTKDVAKDDVKVKVSGTLTNLSLPRVVEGLTLTDGPLTLETMDGGFKLKGDAKLDGKPVTISEMTQYFRAEGREFLTKVDAKVTSDADMRAKFGIDLSDYISGDLPLDISYLDNGKGRETVAAKGDLTSTIVHIRPFQYDKASGVKGDLSLDALMEGGQLTTVNNLAISAPDLSVKNGTLTFRALKGGGADLSGGKLPGAKIGKSVADVDFTVPADNVMKIKAVSPVFDATPFLETSGRRKQSGAQEKSQPLTISLKADKVIALHGQQVTGLTLYTEMDTDSDMTRVEISGHVGQGDVSVMFRPDPETGKRFFRLTTNDGGAVLAAAGLYENVKGGSLMVFGEPKEGGSSTGNLFGTAQLENFRVVKAPALAKLFGLMSLGGLNDLLGQKGIAFSKLEADFEWQFRPEGNLLLIGNGRTSGSSVGLTFEGTLDRGADTTNIRGTIIPMTEINNVLKNIPLLGEILTGGSGLIAATYTMKGPSSDPSVMVNPLSVLAPGFLRKLLFEGGFEKPINKPSAAKAPTNVTPPQAPARTVAPKTN